MRHLGVLKRKLGIPALPFKTFGTSEPIGNVIIKPNIDILSSN